MRYIIFVCSFLFVGLVSAAYIPSVRDQKVVAFFVENLLSMIDSMGDGDHARDVVDALGVLQSQQDDDRKKYIVGEALDRVSLYYNIERTTIVVTGVNRVDLENDADSIGITTITTTQQNYPIASVPVPGPDMMTVTVYRHPRDARDCTAVTPSYLSVPRNKQILQTTIKALLAGPEDVSLQGLAEKDLSGYLRSVVLRDGVAYVDFDSRMRQASRSGDCDVRTILTMLNKTIVGVKGVYDALYAFDGRASDFYRFFQQPCPHNMGYDQCDTAFEKNSLQTTPVVFQQRRWRLRSNAYSVFVDDASPYGDLTQHVYRVCGTGHKRCVSVFDFPSTLSDLVLRLQLKSTRCVQTLKGRLDRCQLSEKIFVTSLDPWKQLVIIRDEGGMTSEDMVDLLSVLGK